MNKHLYTDTLIVVKRGRAELPGLRGAGDVFLVLAKDEQTGVSQGHAPGRARQAEQARNQAITLPGA